MFQNWFLGIFWLLQSNLQIIKNSYDDNEKKVTGGRNGYGAKLCNIFSTEFIVETADAKSGKKFKQIYRNNMGQRSDPEIKSVSKKEEYTKITFKPDLARFHMESIDDDNNIGAVLCSWVIEYGY